MLAGDWVETAMHWSLTNVSRQDNRATSNTESSNLYLVIVHLRCIYVFLPELSLRRIVPD